MNIGWLTYLLLLPVVGALVTLAVPKAKALLAKQVSLVFSVLTLVLTLVIAVGYHQNGAADYEETHTWIGAFGAHFALGLDGVGLVLLVLTALLTPIVQLASWNDAKTGRWSYRYRFTATRGTVRYRFRARVPREAGFPYTSGASRRVPVTVRGL